jgi:hypothetical protein
LGIDIGYRFKKTKELWAGDKANYS